MSGELPQTRTSRIFRIAELFNRYSPELGGKMWKLRDRETGELLPATYPDEPLAKAGARLTAAQDIHALFDGER